MLDLDRPVSQGEDVRVMMVDTIGALAALAGDDPNARDNTATFNEQATQEIDRILHEKGLILGGIGIRDARVSVTDFRRGYSSDFVHVDLTVTPDLPELQERRAAGLGTGEFMMLGLGGAADRYPFPTYYVQEGFVGDTYKDIYEPALREPVQSRVRAMTAVLEELKERDEAPIMALFDTVKGQILAGNATPGSSRR